MRSCRAFSIFELLLVLSLVLIIVTISIPKMGLFLDFAVSCEVQRMEASLHYLQQRAIASNKTHILTFDVINNRYFAMVDNAKLFDNNLESGVKFGFLPNSFGPPANPTIPLTKPVNLDIPIDFDLGTDNLNMSFFSNGKVSPGTIYFVDKYGKRMGALTCSVSNVSYIRKYLYNESRWVAF